MTKLSLFFVTVILCFATNHGIGQFTKQQANDLVINQLLANQLAKVDIYSLSDILTDQSTLAYYDNSTIAIPYNECWVYFVDDLPFANWNHPCRFVFINSSNGNYTITNGRKYPAGWETNFIILSEAQRPNTIEILPNPNATINGLPPNPHMYAVLINGCEDRRYWRDVSSIYHTLINVYGYTKENIFVHYDIGYSVWGNDLDGDFEEDIDYGAYKASIQNTFHELAGETNSITEIPELGIDDQLFVYVTDHGEVYGGHSYIYLPQDQKLFDHEMANMVKNINCSQMIYVMEQCYSGGFVDDLMDFTTYDVACKNRSIHTAANATEYSWPEFHITNSKYDEFVYYWTAAARGYYPVLNEPWVLGESVGSFPFHNYPQLEGHPGDHNPDLNSDGFVQMEEAFAYADFMDTWSPNGYYKPYYSGVAEHPLNSNDIGFTTDLLTCAGYAGIITTNQVSAPRCYVAGGAITVNSGSSMTLTANTVLNFGNGSAMISIQPDANLVIEDNVQFLGSNCNKIHVYGNIQVGQNVTFAKNSTSGSFGGLYLNNNEFQTFFTETTFNRAGFYNYGASLTLNNCIFDNCDFNSYRGSVFVNNTIFENTWLYLENTSQASSATAHILGCSFNNTSKNVGIDLRNFNKYLISDNEIKANKNGIQVNFCGSGPAGNKGIFRNIIHDCSWVGILAYNTSGIIENNSIFNNGVGIKLMNNCNMAVIGQPDAQTLSQTQQIYDNESYELYITAYSFPYLFQYNSIIDEDNIGNPNDPMLLFSNAGISYPQFPKWHVENNCWGSNFNYEDDLWASYGTFKVYPTWCPNGTLPIDDPIKEMFANAMDKMNDGFYNDAKNIFQYLVENYPRSIQGQAALKELLVVEQYLGKDYAELKNYYLSNDSIVSEPLLKNLGEYLANQCDIKLENWSQAINWFENKILNPTCLEDSIFSIIDLGNVYFLLENQGLKSSYSGSLKHFIPETKSKYFEHRDILLSLLPGESLNNKIPIGITGLSNGSLLQNVPNPFAGSTQFWYKVEKQANVAISITDLRGREIIKIDLGIKGEGTYKADFLNLQMASGTYFYSLLLDGKKSDTKKMLIM